jgi:hexosaminidase
LTTVGSSGPNGDGTKTAYTEDEIRELVAYAADRHITIVPEVDVPGHVAAAVAAYPELGNQDFEAPAGPQSEYGVHKWTLAPTKASADFLEAVFSEVARLFPDSEYIHLGGDEAPQDQWQQSSASAKESWEPFEGSNAQSYFNNKVSDIIRNQGKKMAGWDEVQSMEGLPQDAAIFAWRGENELRKALKAGRQVVNAENGHLSLDHYQGPETTEPKAIGGPVTTAKDVYNYHPVPSWVSDEDKHLVLGGQAQLWSEYFPDWKHVEYMAWPRGIALAERLWTPEKELSYDDFSRRLNKRLTDLDHWGVNYHPV